MRAYLKVYANLLKINIKSLVEYKTDFFIGILTVIFKQIVSLLFIYIIFSKISNIEGWNVYEVAYMYISVSLIQNFYNLFFGSLTGFPERYIKRGELDSVLLKPVNELFFIITSYVGKTEITSIITNIIILIIILIELNINNILIVLLLSLIFPLIGAVILAAVCLVICCLSFKYREVLMAIKLILNISEFARYPTDIYPRFINTFITYVIPISIVTFFPIKFIDEIITITIVSLLISFVFSISAYTIWKITLSKYESTGT